MRISIQAKKNLIRLCSLVFLLALPLGVALAQVSSGSGEDGKFKNPIQFDHIREFLTAVLDVVITIAFPIIVLAIVYSGFLFVSSRGNEERLKTAKKALVWTVLGAMLILGAFVLSRAIKGTIDEIKSSGKIESIHVATLPFYDTRL